MTDVLFVTSNHKLKLSNEPNGTMLLATLLRQSGISARILRFAQIQSFNVDYTAFISNITERILAMNPRCVSFYTLWPYYHIMLRIARELKQCKPDLHIIFGGPQASATAEATMNAAPYVDYVCSGEGERSVVQLFSALLDGKIDQLAQIPGLYRRSNGEISVNGDDVPLCDLDSLPSWDEALYTDDYTESQKEMASPTYFMPIDAGRGCPFSCTFCCTSRFWKRTYRLKSAESLIADIRYYKERFGITSFWFTHDAFTTNKKLVEDICDRLLAENMQIRWRCTSRVDLLSEPLVRKMKQAGLVGIEMGVESGSQNVQQRINKKLNLESLQSMVHFLLSEEIEVRLFFMYGFPDETEEELAQTVSLLLNLLEKGVKDATMSFCMFNPATEMTQKYFDELVLDPDCKIIKRGATFGYKEELALIKENKAMFPFFYHLSKHLRNEYQYLYFFLDMYIHYPIISRYLRKLYDGDGMKLYRALCEANKDVFSGELKDIEDQVYHNTPELITKLLARHTGPYVEPLRGILQYEHDTKQISGTKEDTQIQKTYPFSYAEFLMKLPPQQLTEGKSELLLSKKEGKIKCKLLAMV